MCNCGNKRSEYRKANLPQNATAVSPPAVGATNARIKFMYTGRSSLKILGNVSGHLYYFRIRGQMLEVSPDDSSSMMSHPELKIVKA
jgi:hypothetical protein